MIDDRDDNPFVERLRACFDASVGAVDAGTAARLAGVRRRALTEKPRQLSPWVPAGAVATACVALLVYALVSPPAVVRGGHDAAPAQAAAPAAAEMQLISNLELYEDLDFYQWLEQYELPS